MSYFKTLHFTKKDIVDILLIILSAFIYACGIDVFANSGNLFPGGFTGIARLLSLVLKDYFQITVSFSIIYFVLNLIVTLFVYKRIGPKFMIYSFLWFTLTSIFAEYLNLPTITEDILLISVFGGIVNGIAVGLSLKAHGSSGGTDFIAIDLSNRLNRPTWNYILILNICVLLFAGFLYRWNSALYSMIFQYVSNEIIKAIHKRNRVARIEVITDHATEVERAIFETIRHGVTKIPCEGAYSGKSHDLLMIVIDYDQIRETQNCILKVDPKAFITVNSVHRVIGNYLQKPIE